MNFNNSAEHANQGRDRSLGIKTTKRALSRRDFLQAMGLAIVAPRVPKITLPESPTTTTESHVVSVESELSNWSLEEIIRQPMVFLDLALVTFQEWEKSGQIKQEELTPFKDVIEWLHTFNPNPLEVGFSQLGSNFLDLANRIQAIQNSSYVEASRRTQEGATEIISGPLGYQTQMVGSFWEIFLEVQFCLQTKLTYSLSYTAADLRGIVNWFIPFAEHVNEGYERQKYAYVVKGQETIDHSSMEQHLVREIMNKAIMARHLQEEDAPFLDDEVSVERKLLRIIKIFRRFFPNALSRAEEVGITRNQSGRSFAKPNQQELFLGYSLLALKNAQLEGTELQQAVEWLLIDLIHETAHLVGPEVHMRGDVAFHPQDVINYVHTYLDRYENFLNSLRGNQEKQVEALSEEKLEMLFMDPNWPGMIGTDQILNEEDFQNFQQECQSLNQFLAFLESKEGKNLNLLAISHMESFFNRTKEEDFLAWRIRGTDIENFGENTGMTGILLEGEMLPTALPAFSVSFYNIFIRKANEEGNPNVPSIEQFRYLSAEHLQQFQSVGEYVFKNWQQGELSTTKKNEIFGVLLEMKSFYLSICFTLIQRAYSLNLDKDKVYLMAAYDAFNNAVLNQLQHMAVGYWGEYMPNVRPWILRSAQETLADQQSWGYQLRRGRESYFWQKTGKHTYFPEVESIINSFYQSLLSTFDKRAILWGGDVGESIVPNGGNDRYSEFAKVVLEEVFKLDQNSDSNYLG